MMRLCFGFGQLRVKSCFEINMSCPCVLHLKDAIRSFNDKQTPTKHDEDSIESSLDNVIMNSSDTNQNTRQYSKIKLIWLAFVQWSLLISEEIKINWKKGINYVILKWWLKNQYFCITFNALRCTGPGSNNSKMITIGNTFI